MTDAGTIIVSSRWGMPLEQYIPVYGIKQYRPDPVENTRYERARVLDDIKQVSAFSQGGLHDCDHISISTLHSILHYSYSPLSYLDLGSPALITGCIKVMSEIRLMGKVSPLSYELGYACFRVIAIGLSICLLRSGAELGLDPGKIVMEVELLHLTEHVVTHNITRQLQDLAMHLGGHSNDQNHCIIGWSACPEHPRCSAIVSPGDVHILLNMLYDDRSLLLKAFESACPTGISAVVFLLWRYVNYQRYLTGHQTSKEYDLFQTVFWRCFVIATNPEQELFTAIWGQEHGLWPSRKASPMLGVELEDSKTLIVAFINRLGRAKNDLYQTLILTDLLQSLAFIKEHLLPGCQDLIAPCLGAVIEHVWGIFVRQETSDLWSYPNADVPGTLGKIFEEFDIIIQVMLRWREILPETVEQIVKEIIRTELLDLVGRAFLSLSPALDRSQESHTYYVNALVLQCSRALFQNLSKLVSPSILEARFRHYGQDWWKINHQILFLSQGIPPRELSLVGRGFLDTRADVWGSIGKIIQQPIAETSPKLFCGYMRCPDPVIMMGSIYKCAGCRQAAYCSPRCQAMDWWKNNSAVSHCMLCNFRIDRGLDGKTV